MYEIISQDSGLFARYLIGKARHSLLLARQKELSSHNISPRQANVVFVLSSLGNKATLAELAKYTDRGVSALSVQLTRMEKDGIVKKYRENPKSALLQFELTEKGLSIVKETNDKKAYKTIMSVLSEKQLQQLISMLQEVIQASEKYQSEQLPPQH